MDWLLKQHTLGADRIYLMKDKIKSLDKEHDALMEEKRRYEALDLMRSAARLPVRTQAQSTSWREAACCPLVPSSRGRANGAPLEGGQAH